MKHTAVMSEIKKIGKTGEVTIRDSLHTNRRYYRLNLGHKIIMWAVYNGIDKVEAMSAGNDSYEHNIRTMKSFRASVSI